MCGSTEAKVDKSELNRLGTSSNCGGWPCGGNPEFGRAKKVRLETHLNCSHNQNQYTRNEKTHFLEGSFKSDAISLLNFTILRIREKLGIGVLSENLSSGV